MSSSLPASSIIMRAPGNRSARKVRRTQEERSRETRASLIEATCRMLIERGYGKVTVDDISAAAGVTNGARSYHFATKLDLMVAVWMHLRELLDKAAAEAIAQAQDDEPLEVLLKFGAEVLTGPAALAFYELMSGMRVDPAVGTRIRRMASSYREKFHSAWIEWLADHGYDKDEAATLLDATLALFRGMVVDPYAGRRRERIARVAAFWRSRVGRRP
jgi:AcrR family transcriptional regulator